MSLAPSSHSGKVLIQPAYFTSSSYVQTLKNDIDALIKTFEGEYAEAEESSKPFTLFKTVWCAMGWQWLQFKVFDARSRETFLQVTCRIFMERAVSPDTPIARLVALFGLYTTLNTQPAGAPVLRVVRNVPIPRDQHSALLALSESLDGPLRAAAVNIVSLLLKDKVFHIVPDSALGAQAPQSLPREVLVQETAETEAPKKKGRPSKADRAQKAQLALDKLDQWLQKSGVPSSSSEGAPTTHHLLLDDPISTLEQYRNWKTTLLDALDEDVIGNAGIKNANRQIYERLKHAAELVNEPLQPDTETGPGIRRVERALSELDHPVYGRRGGLLGLLDGAGSIAPAAAGSAD